MLRIPTVFNLLIIKSYKSVSNEYLIWKWYMRHYPINFIFTHSNKNTHGKNKTGGQS